MCGKLFPRGGLDLARHSVAVTLQHKVAKTKSAVRLVSSHLSMDSALFHLFEMFRFYVSM